jgi:hypothetical protein
MASAMDQHRNLTMREDFGRLAAKDDCGDAVAAVQGHDDQVATLRLSDIDNRLLGMLMLDIGLDGSSGEPYGPPRDGILLAVGTLS